MKIRILAFGLLMMLSACSYFRLPAVKTPVWEPTATLTAIPPATDTPTPELVEVVLRTAGDSPSIAYFTLYNAAGETVYQANVGPGGSETLYLPPGEYRWIADSPIPTQPAGCYNIFENYGFHLEGRFTAVKDPIRVEVRIGFRLVMCTPTPMGT